MKKLIAIFTLIFTASLSPAFSQNYNNGNGTVIAEETWGDNELQIVRRKHVQTIKMAENIDFPEKNKALWEHYSYLYETKYCLIQEWGIFPLINDCSGKVIHIMEILKISRTGEEPYYTYYVEVEGKKGYMYAEECDFYDKGYWAVVGRINSSGKQWTIRNARYNGWFWVKERLFVRDKPGINGTNKIYLFYKDEELPGEEQWGTEIEVINATEEEETIDGKSGRWLEIVYNNIRGWVFEGYVICDLEFGWTPEDHLELQFTCGYR